MFISLLCFAYKFFYGIGLQKIIITLEYTYIFIGNNICHTQDKKMEFMLLNHKIKNPIGLSLHILDTKISLLKTQHNFNSTVKRARMEKRGYLKNNAVYWENITICTFHILNVIEHRMQMWRALAISSIFMLALYSW